MANTISGKIHLITDVQEIKGKSGNSFYKRQLVIDAKRYDPITGEPKYDNYPSFEFSGDAMKQLDDFKPGDAVTVSYDINGREVKDEKGNVRYFNSIRGYKVEPYGAPQPQPTQQPQTSESNSEDEPPF